MADKKSVPNIEKAKWISMLLFCWISHILKKGSKKKKLESDDLDEVAKTEDSIELTEKLKDKFEKNPKMLIALIKTFGLKILLNSSFAFIEETLRIAQTIALAKFMDFFNDSISFYSSLIYGSLIVISLTICTCIDHIYFWNSARIGLQMQIALRGLLYDKVVSLKQGKIDQGKLENMYSNDLSALENVIEFLPYFIIAPLQLAFVAYYLAVHVHLAFLSGTVILIMFLPIQFITGKILEFLRNKYQDSTDKRINILKEMIAGIKVIKVNSYEKYFEDKIMPFRNNETKYLKYIHMISALNTVIEIDLSVIVTFVSVIFLILFTNVSLNPAYIVYAMAFYTRLNGTLGYFLSKAIKNGVSSFVSIKRVENVLKQDDEHTQTFNNNSTNNNNNNDNKISIYINNYESSRLGNFSIKIEDLNIKKGDLIIVTGQNGSGKSSFLLTLLGEIGKQRGDIDINGNIFYVPQTAWMFNDTIQNNILFHNKYLEKTYLNVIKSCSLNNDFARIQGGDKFIVNENGNNLSGGQKARINLARAMYNNSNIYLFDEPLSAVDVEDSEFIRKECFNKWFASNEKICIIATHRVRDWELFEKARVIEFDNGEIRSNENIRDYINGLGN